METTTLDLNARFATDFAYGRSMGDQARILNEQALQVRGTLGGPGMIDNELAGQVVGSELAAAECSGLVADRSKALLDQLQGGPIQVSLNQRGLEDSTTFPPPIVETHQMVNQLSSQYGRQVVDRHKIFGHPQVARGTLQEVDLADNSFVMEPLKGHKARLNMGTYIVRPYDETGQPLVSVEQIDELTIGERFWPITWIRSFVLPH